MGSSSQGGESFFLPGRTSVRAKMSLVGPNNQGGNVFFCEIRWPVRWVPAVRGEMFFFMKYGGLSGGSLLSCGGIIILRVIRRHFLAAAVDPAVSLSTYSTLPMEVSR